MDDIITQIPPDMASRPVSEWQLNVVTITLVVMLLGRAFKAIRASGGLVGIWRSIVFGITDKQKEDDE